MTVQLDGAGVTVPDVVAVARHREELRLSDAAVARMAATRRIVEELAEGEPAYGISTGFGALANTIIPARRRAALQQSLIRSHAAGMGPAVEAEVVRAMMVLRARTLAFGASGARPQVAGSPNGRRRLYPVREGGLEPPRPFGHRNLNPARLPNSATRAWPRPTEGGPGTRG